MLLSVKEDREQVENSFWLPTCRVSFIFSAVIARENGNPEIFATY